MTLSEIKKSLKNLVMTDLESALNTFHKIIHEDSQHANFSILVLSNFNGLKKERVTFNISEERASLRSNKIKNSLLSVIDSIEENDINNEIVSSILNKKPAEEKTINSPNTSQIYISYAWGGEREEIVNLLDKELQDRGITIIRDKRDLGYKGSIVEFMKDIGKGNKIIVVISEKYLKSENCMFELTQIYENKDFAKRIFPIVLEDANIYSPISRLKYIKYWNDKIEELDTAIKSSGTGLNLTQIQQELNNYGDIRAAFDKMAFILKDMNALTPEIHQNQNFQTLYDELAR